MPLDTDLVVQEVSPETKTACVRPPAMSGCFWILAVPLETRDPQAK
jgi:hypothetical protein